MASMFNEDGTYNKTNWKAGDKITAGKLNKIEESLEAINNNDISRHVEADTRLDTLEEQAAGQNEVTNERIEELNDLVLDNKDELDLAIYDINSRMTFLEDELNEGIAEVNDVASVVDGKITAAEANMTAQVNQGKADMEAMVAEVEADLEGLHAKDEELSSLIKNGYVNIKEYNHLVIDEDYTNAIQTALNEKGCVYLPAGTYNISDTLTLTRYKCLIGEENEFSGNGTVLNYVGELNSQKTVIQMGGNEVGVEPTVDASTVKVKNLYIKCNQNAGFGIYSTYFTNESIIENIKIDSAISHGIYVARGWYGYIKNILVQNSLGCGITLGMPLRYSDGTVVNWTTSAPLELNNIFIEKLRAVSCGKDKTFNYDTNSAWGYGIGCGEGNGFNLKSFLAEKCDGAGLYCRIGSQPTHIVQNGYLENNCTEAVTEGRADKAYTVIYETTNTNAHNIILKDTFISYNHTEGIGQKGAASVKIHLKNISYGRFTSYECETDPFIREECYSDLGYSNADSETFIFPIWSDTANLRYSIDMELPNLLPNTKTIYSIYMITSTDLTFTGGGIYVVDSSNNDILTYMYPKTTVTANTLTYLGKSKNIAKGYKIVEAGTPPFSDDTNVKFVLMASPSIFY